MSKSNQVITPPSKMFLAIDTNGRFTLSKAVWVALGEPEELNFTMHTTNRKRGVFILLKPIEGNSGGFKFVKTKKGFITQSYKSAKFIEKTHELKLPVRFKIQKGIETLLGEICTP